MNEFLAGKNLVIIDDRPDITTTLVLERYVRKKNPERMFRENQGLTDDWRIIRERLSTPGFTIQWLVSRLFGCQPPVSSSPILYSSGLPSHASRKKSLKRKFVGFLEDHRLTAASIIDIFQAARVLTFISRDLLVTAPFTSNHKSYRWCWD